MCVFFIYVYECVCKKLIAHDVYLTVFTFFWSSSWEELLQSVQTALVQVLIVLLDVVQCLHPVKRAYTQELMLMEAAADLHGTAQGENKKYFKTMNVHDVYLIVLTTLND